MPSTRPQHSPTFSLPSDDHQGDASLPYKKPRSEMTESEKREDTKLKNRLKQRAYRQRLADTITSLTAENAALKSSAEEAESLALSQAGTIEDLKRQVAQLKVKVRGEEEVDEEMDGDVGLIDARTEKFSLDAVGHLPPHLSPTASLASEPFSPETSSVDFDFLPPSSPVFLAYPSGYESDTMDIAPPSSLYFGSASSPPSLLPYTNSSFSTSASPYQDPQHTTHLQSLAEFIIYRIEHQHPTFFPKPSSSFEREPTYARNSATSSGEPFLGGVGRNLLGMNLGEGSAGSGFGFEEDWEEGRGWGDDLMMEGLRFSGGSR